MQALPILPTNERQLSPGLSRTCMAISCLLDTRNGCILSLSLMLQRLSFQVSSELSSECVFPLVRSSAAYPQHPPRHPTLDAQLLPPLSALRKSVDPL
jgi:hypothetical protein